MILYTQSNIELIAATESGEAIWYCEFRDDRQQIIQRCLCNSEEADVLIKAGAVDKTDKNRGK